MPPLEAQCMEVGAGAAALTEKDLSEQKTLFQQDWWLDAASCGTFETVEVKWDGTVVASLPFVRERCYGMRRLRMPRYARTLGPAFKLPPAKPVQHRQNMIRVTAELLRKLPPHDSLHTVLHPGAGAGLAMSLAGCDLTAQSTFRVEAARDLDAAWAACDQKTRNIIRKARKTMRVMKHADPDRFGALSRRDRFGAKNYHDFSALSRIFGACHERDQGSILAVHDETGRELGAAMLIWGTEALYFWTTARDNKAGDNSVNALLVWEAMILAQSLGLAFDSDGFSSPEAARFMLRFGFHEATRLSVTRDCWSYHLLHTLVKPLRCSN